MKVIVAYSGGKDSQASLIWSIKEYGVKNVTAVFCDTGWENPITYNHINETTKALGVELIIVKSKTYDGLVDMAKKKGRFPSTKRRFCTEELKTKPMIDFVLEQTDNLIIVQGIRAQESHSRSQMKKQCTFFKYYKEPYNSKGKKFTYRKKDVFKWLESYSDDIIRPVFEWSGQETIDYIIANGQEPNPLYRQGFKRVGCFPCIMCTHSDVKQIMERYPEKMEEIVELEKEIGSSFFKIDSIPIRERNGVCNRTGKLFTTASDIQNYIRNKNNTIDMFKEENISCSSFYHLCE